MHHLDALRALLLLQVVPYHAAILYSTQPEWFVKSDDTSLLMTWISGSLGIFSMTGFFMISGWLTVRYLKTRPVDQWMRIRLERLGIPLVTCMLLLSPLAILAGNIAANERGGAVPGETFGGSYLSDLMVANDRWLGHLWFLPTLLAFSAVIWLACKRGWYAPILKRLGSGLNVIPNDFLCWLVVIAFFAVWRTGFQTAEFIARENWGYQPSLLGILDIKRLAVHFPAIIFGLVIGYNDQLRRRLVRATPLRTMLVLFFMAAFIGLSGAETFSLKVFQTVIQNGLGIAICMVLIGGLENVFSRPQGWVSFISRHSYSVYLFHFAPVVLLGVAMRHIQLPPLVEFVTVVTLTLTIAFSLAVLVSRSRILSFLFNGVPPGEYRRTSRQMFRTSDPYKS
ncbi:acyltransferase family protein [Henriciella sp.]|uniref:acyltransferase family protein n=1 Tax=Henriciella sp. TaxID=1968823 RepID=UPI00260EB1B0|nr:acyltransferase family protein [Henriciella sp.]